jgi:replication factor C subunit 3/5
LISVIILYEVDKAAENIQHLIKWIIDRYSDICKLVLCCEDDENIIASVKNRFKVINVDAPQTHEVRMKKFRNRKYMLTFI